MSNGSVDRIARTRGWFRKWLKRYAVYTILTWTVSTIVFVPIYSVILRLSGWQIVVYAASSLPVSIGTYMIMAPYGRWVWQSIWRMEHGVSPWWRRARL